MLYDHGVTYVLVFSYIEVDEVRQLGDKDLSMGNRKTPFLNDKTPRLHPSMKKRHIERRVQFIKA